MAQLNEIFNQQVGQTADPVNLKQAIDAIRALLNSPGIANDNIAPGAVGTEELADGAATDPKIGNRTITETAPLSDTAQLGVLLNNLAYMILAITGKTDWKIAPIQTIEQIKSTADTDRTNFNNHKSATVLDHPDGSVTDAKIGNRTITPAAPTVDINTLGVLLNNLAQRIIAITGKSDWKIDPVQTIEVIKSTADTDRNNFNTHNSDAVRHITAQERTDWNTHKDAPAPHTGHETPDGAQAKVDAHANRTDNPHGVTATQVGALTGINDVVNPGGAVTFVGGTGILIATDNVDKRVVITATTEAVPGPHMHSDSEINLTDINNYYVGGTLDLALNEIYQKMYLRKLAGVI